MAELTPNNRQENWYKGIIDGSTTLTPNNRREYWYQGMIDGSTDLTPNNRREAWYKAIVDSKGGGGGGDFTTAKLTLTYTTSDGEPRVPVAVTENDISYATSSVYIEGGSTIEVDVILYKGNALIELTSSSVITDVNTTGSITEFVEGVMYGITGDCSITVVNR